MTLLAYRGDPARKAAALDRARQHREMDHLVRGAYWMRGRGCAVGCTVRDLSGEPLVELTDVGHGAYPAILGVPEVLAHLEDQIFESLPGDDAMEWPERFLAAIPVGADLDLVWPRFALWMLADPEHGVLRLTERYPECAAAIRGVRDLYSRLIDGDVVSEREWDSARAAATREAARARAAAWAARAAAWAARAEEAARAAWAAWAAWEEAAEEAARAAWAAEAARAAADQLVALLESAPVIETEREVRAAWEEAAEEAARAAWAAEAARAAADQLVALLESAPVIETEREVRA